MKIIIVANTAWNIANFRLGLIQELQAKGYEVVAVAPADKHVSRITALGVRFVPIAMDNKGTNPLTDIFLFLRLILLFSKEKPSWFLGFTIKPNIYGGLAAALCGIPAINNIAGLGTAFIRNNWLTWFASLLYRLGLAKARRVFFQNEDDLSLFIERGLAPSSVVERLPGSGVNINWFSPNNTAEQVLLPPSYKVGHLDHRKKFHFLLTARLLWDKGVGEFVNAAKLLQEEKVDAKFQLLGFLDVANRTAIPRKMLESWVRLGVVDYLGEATDVRPMIAQADCIVLPSYREGTPRSLLEAASMAKPIITTDTAGCRDVVVNGETGFLCRPRDAGDLACKMKMMLSLTQEAREAMGRKGRERILREFDEKIIIEKYLKTIIEDIN